MEAEVVSLFVRHDEFQYKEFQMVVEKSVMVVGCGFVSSTSRLLISKVA
jgi:hypothetical protein